MCIKFSGARAYPPPPPPPLPRLCCPCTNKKVWLLKALSCTYLPWCTPYSNSYLFSNTQQKRNYMHYTCITSLTDDLSSPMVPWLSCSSPFRAITASWEEREREREREREGGEEREEGGRKRWGEEGRGSHSCNTTAVPPKIHPPPSPSPLSRLFLCGTINRHR